MWLKKTVPTEKVATASIQFLGEQEGDMVEKLKTNLMPTLRAHPSIESGYLARVAYASGEKTGVALCLYVTEKATQDRLGAVMGQIFARVFDRKQSLDILFLSEEQKAQIQKVCTAFYQKGQN